MSENPFASPVETEETLAEETPAWQDYPREMSRVKWGMVWIAASVAGFWGLRFYFYFQEWIFLILCAIHMVGMIFCCLCPESVMKRREKRIGWVGVLLFGIFLAGLWLPSFGTIPVLDHWAWGAFGIGILVWLVFLVILSRRIRGGVCVGLACAVLLADSLVAVIILLQMLGSGFPLYEIWWIVPAIMIVYPLLIVYLWWRIRKMRWARRETEE